MAGAPRVYRTQGIVLKRTDMGEADKVLTIYTFDHGKVRAVGKGIRRPGSRLGGHLDLLTRSQLMLARGRNLDYVTQAETVDSFIGLRDDLVRASHGYTVAELVDRLTEDGHEDRPTYAALVEVLGRIATDPDPELAVRMFEITLLDRLGYRPQLRTCGRCRAELPRADCFYSQVAGGVLCADCGLAEPTARPLSANAFAMLRLLQSGNWEVAGRVRKDEPLRREIEAVLRAQIQYVLERDLKSSAFVSRVRAVANSGAT